MKFNLAIIDMDPLVYRCGFSVEKYNKDLGIYEIEPLEHALYNVNSMMRYCLKESGTSNYQGFLTSSDKSNFRFSLFKDYKVNRKEARKPYWYTEIREFLVKKWKALVVYGEEADDACSIYTSRCNSSGYGEDIFNSIVWSFDKDFKNIPGWHGNYVTKQIFYISELDALRNFYLQILTGDTSDGIPRIKKGWKKKEVEKKINNSATEKEIKDVVYKEIRELHPELSEEEVKDLLILRGQLVWLRRKPNEMWS